jgi:YVTN family beta-propeller protein
MRRDPVGRRIASLIVIGTVGTILLFPPSLATIGVFSPPHASNSIRPSHAPAILPRPRRGLGPASDLLSPSQGFGETTIDLLNGTVFPGNFVNRADGIGPGALTYVPSHHTVYAAEAVSNGVSVVNTTTNSSSLMINVGSDPVALSYDATNGTLWSANYGSGTVSVIDTASEEVAQTLNVGLGPASLAYDPVTETVYICLEAEDLVLAVSGESYAIEARIAVGTDPVVAYYDPASGLVYVANFDSNNVSVIDPATNRVTGDFPTGIGPGAITSNGQSGLLYVANWYGNVTEFDPTTNQSVGQVFVNYLPSSLAFDNVTDRLYVVLCCAQAALIGQPPAPANLVTVVNGTTNKILTNISVGSYPEAIVDDPDNGLLYVGNFASNNLSVVRAASDTDVRTVPLGRAPTGLAFDPRTNGLFVADSQSNVVSVIDTTKASLVENISLGLEVYSAAYDPANRTVAVTDPTGVLWFLNATTYEGNAVLETAPAFGSSPTAITYCSEANDMVYSDFHSIHTFNASTYNFFDARYLANNSLGPDPIACNPTSPDLFVTVGATDQLVVLDLSNLTPVATVSVGSDPSGVAFDPEDSDVYVADSGTDQLTVVSALTNQVIGQIPVGANPEAVAFDPFDGEIYVANAGSANLSVIDPAAARAFASIPTGLAPVDVEVNPDNNTLYVANYLSATVSVISPHWAAYPLTFQETGLPSGTRWGVSIGGPEVSSLSSSLIFEVPNGTYEFSVGAPTGYEASPASGILEIDASGITRTITLSKIPQILAWANWTSLGGTGPCCPSCVFTETVQFFGNGSGGSPPYSYSWTFEPGGGSSEAQNPQYTFTSSAATAVLVVGDRSGDQASRELNMTWSSSCPSSPATPGMAGSATLTWGILGAATIVAVAVGAVAWRRSRRSRL